MAVIDAHQKHGTSAQCTTARFRGHGWRGEFIAGTPLHEWFLQGGRPDELGTPSDLLVRDGSRSRCTRIERLTPDGSPLPEPLFFKSYRIRPGVQAFIKRRIGWHRSSWAWRLGWTVHRAGVHIALPWGYLVPQLWRGGRCSYLWTQWIEGTRHAKDFVTDLDDRRVLEREYFQHGAADVLAKLHNAGVYHRDLNWGNLMLDPLRERIWLVDLDSAQRLTLSPRRAASRDVARFLLDALRYEMTPVWQNGFLNRYAEMRGISASKLSCTVGPLLDLLQERRRQRGKWPATARSAPRGG